jgi:hypothetical protein
MEHIESLCFIILFLISVNYAGQVVSTSAPVTSTMQAAVSLPSAPQLPPYCSEPIQMIPHPMQPQNTMPPSQPIFSNTQIQLPQPQMAAAPIMTPIPLPIPNQHMMQTQVPILGPNLRAQVISAVAPQTHIMPAVNCVSAVRHPITSSVPSMIPQSVAPTVVPQLAKQPASSPVGNNSAAALVGPSVKPSVKAKSQVLSASKKICSLPCVIISQLLLSLNRFLQGKGILNDLPSVKW